MKSNLQSTQYWNIKLKEKKNHLGKGKKLELTELTC
jgi:hypothetical protein